MARSFGILRKEKSGIKRLYILVLENLLDDDLNDDSAQKNNRY
jgi:hypothetical protein